MKRTTFLVTLFVVLSMYNTVKSQVFYTYPNGAVIETSRVAVGAVAGLGEHDLVRGVAYGRLGIAKYFDAGLELALDSQNSLTRYGLGGDVKFTPLAMNKAIPFDLSINGGLGYLGGDGYRLWLIPLGAMISTPYQLETGRQLIPYLGVYFLISNTDVDVAGGSISDTDFDVEARGGVQFRVSDNAGVFATIHVGADTAFYLGLAFDL